MSLFNKVRPKSLREIVGQESVVRVLGAKLKEKSLPHTVLFTGPTGSGKSTLASITAQELGCDELNLIKINCADERGMDMVRDINSLMHTSAMGGGPRIWMLEEVIQLPKPTQKVFLDILENPPAHVYFLLCANDTTGLLDTFLGRCFTLKLAPLTRDQLSEVLSRALKKIGGFSPEPSVIRAIVNNAEGSARVALQLLEAVLTVEGEKAQLEAVQGGIHDKPEAVEFLAKALMRRANWLDLAKALKGIQDQDVEGLRRSVLAYMSAVLLNGGDKSHLAYSVIEAFKEPFYTSGKAGLTAAVWKCTQMAR